MYLGMQQAQFWGGTENFHMNPIIGGGLLQHKLKLLFPSWISVLLHMLCQSHVIINYTGENKKDIQVGLLGPKGHNNKK